MTLRGKSLTIYTPPTQAQEPHDYQNFPILPTIFGRYPPHHKHNPSRSRPSTLRHRQHALLLLAFHDMNTYHTLGLKSIM